MPAARPTTRNSSGFDAMTSRLDVPMEPVEPRIMSRFISTMQIPVTGLLIIYRDRTPRMSDTNAAAHSGALLFGIHDAASFVYQSQHSVLTGCITV